MSRSSWQIIFIWKSLLNWCIEWHLLKISIRFEATLLENNTGLIITRSPIVEESIVMTTSVCLSVRLQAYRLSYVSVSTKFLCMSPVAMARSAVCVLPVLWMTSCSQVMARNRRHNRYSMGSSVDLTPWHIMRLTHQGADLTGSGVWCLCLPCCVFVSIAGLGGTHSSWWPHILHRSQYVAVRLFVMIIVSFMFLLYSFFGAFILFIGRTHTHMNVMNVSKHKTCH